MSEFVYPLKLPVVSSLPAASSLANRMVVYNGKIYYSDGASWLDLMNADTLDSYHASQTPTANTIVVSKSDKTIDDKWLPSTIARKTVSAVTIYVDNVNGSDTTGNGSSSAPYATFSRALQDVGEFYDADVTIVLKKSATSYGTLRIIGRIRQNPSSILTIRGELNVLVSGAVSSHSNSVDDPVYSSLVQVARITDDSKNWSVDQYKDKLLRVYKGSTSYYRIITNNDATNLYCSYTFPVAIDNTWSYEILDWGTRCDSIGLHDCGGQVMFNSLHIEPTSDTYNAVVRNSKYTHTFSYCKFKPYSSQTNNVLLCNHSDLSLVTCLLDMGNISTYAINLDKGFNSIGLTGCIFNSLMTNAIVVNYSSSRISITDGTRFYRGTGNPTIGIQLLSGSLIGAATYGKVLLDAGSIGISLTRTGYMQNSSAFVFGSNVTTPISSHLGLVDGTRLLVYDYLGVNITNHNYLNLHSRLQVAGSIATQVTTVITDTTLGVAHHIVLVDASSGNRTITLPNASGITGRQYIIKKIDSSSNTVTITPQSGQTIDGQGSLVLNTQYQFVGIVSSGNNWYRIE